MKENLVTLEELNSLKDEQNLTIANQKKILYKIDKKVDEIWRYICKKTNRKLEWWDFSNCGSGSKEGFFDIKWYDESIEIAGEWNSNDAIIKVFHDEFPTSYLYDPNWMARVDKEIKSFLNKKEKKPSKKEENLKLAEEIKRKVANNDIQFILKNQKLFKIS